MLGNDKFDPGPLEIIMSVCDIDVKESDESFLPRRSQLHLQDREGLAGDTLSCHKHPSRDYSNGKQGRRVVRPRYCVDLT